MSSAANFEPAFSEQLPGLLHYLGGNVTAHMAALKGLVARTTPDAGFGGQRIQLGVALAEFVIQPSSRAHASLIPLPHTRA